MSSFLIFDIETIVDPELPIVDGPDAVHEEVARMAERRRHASLNRCTASLQRRVSSSSVEKGSSESRDV